MARDRDWNNRNDGPHTGAGRPVRPEFHGTRRHHLRDVDAHRRAAFLPRIRGARRGAAHVAAARRHLRRFRHVGDAFPRHAGLQPGRADRAWSGRAAHFADPRAADGDRGLLCRREPRRLGAPGLRRRHPDLRGHGDALLQPQGFPRRRRVPCRSRPRGRGLHRLRAARGCGLRDYRTGAHGAAAGHRRHRPRPCGRGLPFHCHGRAQHRSGQGRNRRPHHFGVRHRGRHRGRHADRHRDRPRRRACRRQGRRARSRAPAPACERRLRGHRDHRARQDRRREHQLPQPRPRRP